MTFKVVVPARYASSRLPGKPLIEIGGVPMILRTVHRCLQAVDRSEVLVATDDERIKATCEQDGIQVVMTSSNCLTGTDRVAEVAEMIAADTYVSVQGDEPLFSPSDLEKLIAEAQAHPDQVINGFAPITSEADFRNPSIPKAVVSEQQLLLYMSRAPIPTNKEQAFLKSWRQICAYAFPRSALSKFAQAKSKTTLEAIEDIEILRFVEMGIPVRMIAMSTDSIAVDTPEDVEKVEAALAESKSG